MYGRGVPAVGAAGVSPSEGVEAGERPVNLVIMAIVFSTMGASSTGPTIGPTTGTCNEARLQFIRIQGHLAPKKTPPPRTLQ